MGPAFLEKDAKLKVDPPRVVLGQALDRIEAAQADGGVDLDVGPHVHDAVQETLLERLAGARVRVLDREGVFDRGHALHIVGGAAVFERRDAVEYPRLVEVEVALHQSRGHESPAGIHAFAVAGNAGLDRGDTSIGDCDIDCCARVAAICEPRIAQDETEGHFRAPLHCEDS